MNSLDFKRWKLTFSAKSFTNHHVTELAITARSEAINAHGVTRRKFILTLCKEGGALQWFIIHIDANSLIIVIHYQVNGVPFILCKFLEHVLGIQLHKVKVSQPEESNIRELNFLVLRGWTCWWSCDNIFRRAFIHNATLVFFLLFNQSFRLVFILLILTLWILKSAAFSFFSFDFLYRVESKIATLNFRGGRAHFKMNMSWLNLSEISIFIRE